MTSRRIRLERGDHVELGELLLRQVKGTGPDPVRDEGALYAYDKAAGVWQPVSAARQSVIVQGYAGFPVSAGKGKRKRLKLKACDVRGAIALGGDQATVDGFFLAAPRGIAFSDCFVTVTATGVKVRGHSPKNRIRHGYGFAYDPAFPRRWLAFLTGLFRDDADRDGDRGVPGDGHAVA